MADSDRIPDRPLTNAVPVARPGAIDVSAEDFQAGFGEALSQTLDLASWQTDRNIDEEYRRIEEEVRQAVGLETDVQKRLRQKVLPRLAEGPGAPPGAGLYSCTVKEIARVHQGILFNGGVEACDGTHHTLDTLPLTVHQIGVCLVSYCGDRGTWHQRLFRHDLRQRAPDPVQEVLELLERRSRRGGLYQSTPFDRLSELAQRAIMSYAERAILLRRSKAPWRLGHGSPAPHELLNGGGSADVMIESLRIIRELIEGHRKFVFVASEPGDRALLTLGDALHPLEYAIVATLNSRIEPFLDRLEFYVQPTVDTRWDGRKLAAEDWVRRFRDEVAPQVVVGVYRATLLAPAQVFYAHVDCADLAARVALADSALQEERGFPLLIDLADRVCKSVYGGNTLEELAATAFAAVGAPCRYRSERRTRI